MWRLRAQTYWFPADAQKYIGDTFYSTNQTCPLLTTLSDLKNTTKWQLLTSQRTTINARLHMNSLLLAIAITSVQVMDYTCNFRGPSYDDPCHRLIVCVPWNRLVARPMAMLYVAVSVKRVYFQVNDRERLLCMLILLYNRHCNAHAMWNVLRLFDCSFDSFHNCCPRVWNCLEGDVNTHYQTKRIK
jgi:hypothetical protein